jgi:type VI secretion system secreted protein VgrG
MCQYGESSFDFINRLSAEYGEWFFYDGSDLCFGRPSKQENVELVYGSNISSMNYAMQILPSNADIYSYKSSDDNVLMASLPSVDTTSSLTKTALKRSDELYRKPIKQPAAIRISDQSQMDAHAKVQKGKDAARTMLLKATGDSPKVLLGNNVTIKLSKLSKPGFDDHGEYLVTNVSHFLTGTGSYKNTMEAIPSANEIIPFTAAKPVAQTQMAVVLNNNDPKGMGRVQVQMLWQQDTHQKTDWIRVMTPDAGGGKGKDVSKNRGQVFVPEVGDQVLIGFRYNDPSRPFVFGSLFHGSIASGGGKQNEIKSMTTKAGSTLIFNDTDHTVRLQTSKGNTVHVNEKSGAITISSGSSISINSKNISINGSESINILSPKITIGSLGGEHPTDTVDVMGKAVTVEGEDTAGVKSKALTLEGTDEYTDKGGKYSAEMSEMQINGGSKIAMSSSDTDIS